jgi:hypothetical protein
MKKLEKLAAMLDKFTEENDMIFTYAGNYDSMHITIYKHWEVVAEYDCEYSESLYGWSVLIIRTSRLEPDQRAEWEKVAQVIQRFEKWCGSDHCYINA